MKKVTTGEKICLKCGNLFSRGRASSGRIEGLADWSKRKFCSHTCFSAWHTGGNHYRFKPEGSSRSDGYVRVSIRGKRAYLHHVVIEEQLGRPLEKEEQVHHKDENPANNDLDNLVLTKNGEHRRLYHADAPRDEKGRYA